MSERPRITVEFPYDPEDDTKRSATSQTFFAAWVNQFGDTEWTCTDEIDGPTDFAPLVDFMDGPELLPDGRPDEAREK